MSDDDYSEIDNIPTKNATEIKKPSSAGLVVTLMIAIAVAAFFVGYFVASIANSDNITESEVKQIIAEEISKIQAAAPVQPTTQARPAPLIVPVDDDPVKGNPNAPITLIEFSDFQCPFCSKFYHETLPLIEENYVQTGLVKIVYRDFAIDRIHPNAVAAHIASECADEQGKFWAYHDILFSRQSEWNGLSSADADAKFFEYAQILQLDDNQFSTCVSSPQMLSEINADKQAGSAYGVTGTPAFFVGNDNDGYVLVSGAKPYTTFQQIFDQQLG